MFKTIFAKFPSRIDVPCCSKAVNLSECHIRCQHANSRVSVSRTVKIPAITPSDLSLKKDEIEMVPEKLHRHLFRSEVPSKCSNDSINFELPLLRKEADLMGHFDTIGREQFDGYLIRFKIQNYPALLVMTNYFFLGQR